jgi:hypothetical protein
MGTLVTPLPRDASQDEYDAWMQQHSQEHSALQVNTAAVAGIATGTFDLVASRALTGTVTFNYIRIGTTNFLWCPLGISGAAQGIFLTLSFLPTIMTPSQSVHVFGGALVNGGGSSLIASIDIHTDGTININGCLSTVNGISGGQSLQGLCGLATGFSFNFTTI